MRHETQRIVFKVGEFHKNEPCILISDDSIKVPGTGNEWRFSIEFKRNNSFEEINELVKKLNSMDATIVFQN